MHSGFITDITGFMFAVVGPNCKSGFYIVRCVKLEELVHGTYFLRGVFYWKLPASFASSTYHPIFPLIYFPHLFIFLLALCFLIMIYRATPGNYTAPSLCRPLRCWQCIYNTNCFCVELLLCHYVFILESQCMQSFYNTTCTNVFLLDCKKSGIISFCLQWWHNSM